MSDADVPTPPAPAPPAPARPADETEVVLPEQTLAWVEQFALTWEGVSSPRMEGRIVGLLMVVDRPYLSSQQIARLLSASAGAVSTATRRLLDIGFIQRHAVPGDRNHYFGVEDDIWGSWLERERQSLPRFQRVIDEGLAAQPDRGTGPGLRLVNARNYMEWLAGHHRQMLAEWQAYRDAQARTGDQ